MKELLNKIHHADCLEFMKQLPDKSIDLVLTDPPYGLGSIITDGGTWSAKYTKKDSDWDVVPTAEVFDEIMRISKNQIIWGGNYFTLPPTRGFLVWKKLSISESFSMAMCEYAYTSFQSNAKLFEHIPDKTDRFHPTQKPLQLFKWCLNFTKLETGIVLDCFSGSGTTALACHDLGLDFICIEKDADYYKASVERLEKHKRQLKLL